MMPLPAEAHALRLAFYGDDFTGASDALEVLAFAGLRCALFLTPPTRAALTELGGFDAIGIAGDSRGMSPGEMDTALPSIFRALAALDTPIVHYKVCSTFDSAPSVGSIGHIIDIAREIFGTSPIPIVASTPALARFCLFGTLFARCGTDGRMYRIDRHPIMSVHPVTPMNEGDLGIHLGRQTALAIDRFELPHFAKDRAGLDAQMDRSIAAGPAAVLFDAATAEHLTEIGRLLERQAQDRRPSFVVGSSGVEYALTQWWAESRPERATTQSFHAFAPVDHVLAISGSASALSALQIDAAIAAGFTDLPIDAAALVDDARWERASHALVTDVIALLVQGRSPMLHTARGPNDPRIAAFIDSLVARGQTREQARHEGGRLLGYRLGAIVEAILQRHPLPRLLLSGGDTSSQITRALGPDALEIEARLAPGAPLCRAISSQSHLKALQIALKGGQMGDADYFVKALRGRAADH